MGTPNSRRARRRRRGKSGIWITKEEFNSEWAKFMAHQILELENARILDSIREQMSTMNRGLHVKTP